MNYDDSLMHYGMPKRSGRYPWGSGKESYQRTEDFLARVERLKKDGKSEKEVAEIIGLTTTKLRIQMSMANSERRAIEVSKAQALRDKGMSYAKIAEEMGYKNDSSIISLLNKRSCQRMDEASNIAALLKKHIDEKGLIDVGAGVEKELGTSKEKLKQAMYMLEMEGYKEYGGGVAQATNGNRRTVLKVMGGPDSEHKDIYDYSKVHTIHDYNTRTGDANADPVFKYPTSVDLKRVKVRYAEEGGTEKDGTIEIRRGVQDLSLGNSHYSQVRILVDNDRYLKGVAVYKDDDNFPKGVDIMFNTNKKSTVAPRDVFKPITDDPDNPFGSSIRKGGQSYYIDSKTGERKLSAINKRADEGDWHDWSEGLPSQFLSKQSMPLIKKQLDATKADTKAEYDEIMSITNPTIKRHLLNEFASKCDSSAEHLKAASLPRQKYQVILPVNSLKDTEVYAPNFADGEKLALVRFPHGGTFEIPILTVNNKNKEGIALMSKNPKDAVGINSRVAERLSGADFDGDTVLALPTGGKTKIISTDPLKGLVGFDNKAEYPARPGMKVMTKDREGIEMGVISNLITDMTLRGANNEELTRAVKHSMVVIDAKKHKLDYKKSEEDNGIAALKKAYQKKEVDGEIKVGGASTLISQSKGEVRVDPRQGSPKVNIKGTKHYDPTRPEGALIYNSKPEIYIDKNGKEKRRTISVTKMSMTDDARTLSSGTPQEEAYADYANYMKSMANQSRKAMVETPRLKYEPEAKKQYKEEVDSITAKLNTSLKNAPRERQAQLMTNAVIKEKKKLDPSLESDPDRLKKVKQKELEKARAKVGAERKPIVIEDGEWKAIQAGAITDNVLRQIIINADIDSLRSRATPRTTNALSDVKLNRMKAMKNSGYTNEQIAKALGVSVSSVINNS